MNFKPAYETNQRYWDIHFLYVLNIFKYLKCNITYSYRPDFIVTINGKDFLFDYWDKSDVQPSNLPIFKFHCVQETNRVFCFPPVSFYDWDRYYKLEKDIKYNPLSSFWISSRQVPYGDAIERRTMVQAKLQKLVDDNDRLNKKHGWIVKDRDRYKILTGFIHQEDYWKEINNIDIAVFVPGHHNNMIDRGHLQYLSFGCLTISPDLPECLPFGKKLIGYDMWPQLIPTRTGCHYLKCKDDYSNLLNIIMWKGIHSFVHPFVEIGMNAKTLFKETCTPEAIGQWIKQHL